MSDFDSNYPSTETLARLRHDAIFFLVGGLVLTVCRFIVGRLALTVGAGLIICAVGIGWLMANNPANKKTGALVLGAGILVMLSGVRISIFPIITGILLSIISLWLLVKGVIVLFQYFAAQRGR